MHRQYKQKVLDAQRFAEQIYNAFQDIMRLALAYTSQRLEAACKGALAGQAYNYTTIYNILINNFDTIELLEAQ